MSFIHSRRRVAGRQIALCSILLPVLGCAPHLHDDAHGHDHPHGAAEHSREEELQPVAITSFSDSLALFIEHPRLVAAIEARFLAHVTVRASGEPVREGWLRLELQRPDQAMLVFEATAPTRDGLFIPVGAAPAAGAYETRLVIGGGPVAETIPLPPLIVHGSRQEAVAAQAAEAEAEPPDAVAFLLEQQWKLGVLTQPAARQTLSRRIRVAGGIEAPQGALAAVGTSVAGRLRPPESGALPQLGERVEPGQLLAWLEPPLTLADAAQLAGAQMTRDTLELELLTQAFDVRSRALEFELARHQAEARLTFARQALQRLEALRTKGLGTLTELEAAQRDVEVALREQTGTQALEAALALARQGLDDLTERSEAVLSAQQPEAQRRHPLVAPIGGEIIDVRHVVGEHVDSSAAIFRILDAEQVWIVAHVPEVELWQLGSEPGAHVQVSAFPGRLFDVTGELAGRVVGIGREIDPRTRTVALRYAARNPEQLLRPGMFADVFIETGRSLQAVAVPEAAVVIDGGRPVAFVLLGGETFQKRELELGIRDGSLVEVRAGIAEGEFVVTRGAYALKLAAAAPASFGAGHVH